MKIWEKISVKYGNKDIGPTVKFESSINKNNRLDNSLNHNDTNPNILGERRKEKENMSDFIEKKREMFLVQMSLDTKRDEIRKLEEKAQMKEQALLKSELMLEEDALRFDAFLKENDIKAHQAIKRHEKEVKEKQEKISKIKKLNQEIAKVKSEMDKYNETLAYCRKYKAFLDELTPREWFIEQENKKIHKKEIIKQWNIKNNDIIKRNKDRDSKREILISQLKNLDETDEKYQIIHNQLNEISENSVTPTPPSDNDDDDDNDDNDNNNMYFKSPEQLLQVFATLEERNLFLIQNAQETEEAFDELKSKFQETKNSMQLKTSELESSIIEMKSKIEIQENKANNLRNRLSLLGASGDNKQQKLLNELGNKVANVFSQCGFDPEQTPDTLGKLAKIEQLLESLIIRLQEMPENVRKKAEKRKEAERRDRLRREKVLKMEKEYQQRLKRSLERAKRVEERVKKQKKGKPKMFRSAPIKKKKKKQSSIDKQKEEQEKIFKKFFT